MNLLLLLSALLTALCGGGEAGRGTRVAQTMCTAVATVGEARVSARVVAQRPFQALPSIIQLVLRPGIAFALIAAEPAFASRRRE